MLSERTILKSSGNGFWTSKGTRQGRARELVVTGMILDPTLRTKPGMVDYVPDLGSFV